MAHIRTRKLADGSTAYVVRWEDPAGNRPTRQFSKANCKDPATQAKNFKIRIEAELLRGTYVDPNEGQRTFRDYCAEWLESQHTRRTTTERTVQILTGHIYPLIGDMRIGAIRRREVQTMVNALTVKRVGGRRGEDNPRPVLAPSYVQNMYLVVAGIFKAAVLDQVIPVSPCVKIKLPEVTKEKIVIPTPEQVEIVASRISPRYAALVLLAAGTGLRSAEARGLDLERLRVLERTVTVDRQIHVPQAGEWYYGPPKTDAGYRDVPLTESYAQVIAEHIERHGLGVDGLVFTGRSRQPIRRNNLASALSPVLRDLGFPPRSGMHLFRHYYVSGLIAAGLDVVTVMARVGHESSEETFETYGHLWHDREDRTREAVEASFPLGHKGLPQGPRRTAKALTGPPERRATVTPITLHELPG